MVGAVHRDQRRQNVQWIFRRRLEPNQSAESVVKAEDKVGIRKSDAVRIIQMKN
jgi:hypothetical protein